jgi:hypothetical protein
MTGDRRESSIPLEYAEANRRPTARLSALGTARYAKNKYFRCNSLKFLAAAGARVAQLLAVAARAIVAVDALARLDLRVSARATVTVETSATTSHVCRQLMRQTSVA